MRARLERGQRRQRAARPDRRPEGVVWPTRSSEPGEVLGGRRARLRGRWELGPKGSGGSVTGGDEIRQASALAAVGTSKKEDEPLQSPGQEPRGASAGEVTP